ncbi:glycine betaine ABC transporter substrate-binding protein [Streptomyces sp. NPDC055709]
MLNHRFRTSVFVSAALLFSAITVSACTGGSKQERELPLSGASFVVGSADSTEQLILAQMTIQLLRSAGADVSDRTNLRSPASAREALRSGKISMYWEYTGTAWVTHLKNAKPITNLSGQLDAVATADLQENGIIWLHPAPFSRTHSFAARKDTAQRLGVETLSDLAELSTSRPKEATVCISREASSRDYGFAAVAKEYGIESTGVRTLNADHIYTETAKGDACNFGEVLATDGRVHSNNLVTLKDDKEFFPSYQPALTMKVETATNYLELHSLFTTPISRLTMDVMRELNARAEVDGEKPYAIAESWLKENGLLP